MGNVTIPNMLFFAFWQASLFSFLTLIQGMHILAVVIKSTVYFKRWLGFDKYMYMIGSFPDIKIKALSIIPGLGRVCYLVDVGLGPAFLLTSSI